MENGSPPLSIKVIYVLTQFIFWVSILASTLVVVLLLGKLAGFGTSDAQTSLSIPVKVDVEETGTLHIGNEDYAVNIVDAVGTFNFQDLPDKAMGYIIPFLLFFFALVLALIWFFRKLIINVRKGSYFTEQNSSYLKKMAYVLLALWIFLMVFSHIFVGFMISTMHFETVSFSGVKTDSSWILFSALFLWVLSHIFSTGVKLQQEQDLTV